MTKRQKDDSLVGSGTEQTPLLSMLDRLGNNGWDVDGQADELMPRVLGRLNVLGMPLQRIKEELLSSGHDDHALRRVDRWERKRTTGSFD